MQEYLVIAFEVLIILIILVLAFYKFYFLRNPSRETPNSNNILVSPANGKIISIIHQNNSNDNHKELYKCIKK